VTERAGLSVVNPRRAFAELAECGARRTLTTVAVRRTLDAALWPSRSVSLERPTLVACGDIVSATMPIVRQGIGGEPYGDGCDSRSLSGHALTATPNLAHRPPTAPGGGRFQHNCRDRLDWAVSGPACRLRCRPTALAPPNRRLRKLLAAEGLPRAARRQVRNPLSLRPLGHARPPTRTRRHLGAASHRAHYAGEADPDRTPAPVVHQVGVQTQGLPTACWLCTTQICRTASLCRHPPPSLAEATDSDDGRCQRGHSTSGGLELSWLERESNLRSQPGSNRTLSVDYQGREAVFAFFISGTAPCGLVQTQSREGIRSVTCGTEARSVFIPTPGREAAR